jgi:hypothetical protein
MFWVDGSTHESLSRTNRSFVGGNCSGLSKLPVVISIPVLCSSCLYVSGVPQVEQNVLITLAEEL